MTNIYNKFRKENNTEMTFEEFQILILIYPIFLVAVADGIFDEDEKSFVKEILLNLLQPLYKSELTEIQYESLVNNYILDLDFLHSNKENFSSEFLSALNSFDQEVKLSISELLSDVAEASGGLSEKENLVIESLKSKYL